MTQATATLLGQSTKVAKKPTPKWRKASGVNYFILGLVTFASAFPFYWMFIVASSGNEAIAKIPPAVIPGGIFMKSVSSVYENVDMNIALLNTLFVGLVVAFCQVMLSAIAGFAFAKLNFKGSRYMVLFVIGTMMLPSQLGIIPLFIFMVKLGWVDTLTALIVPALVTAFGVFWMRQIIDAQVPNELLEAASIDGAGVLRVFWSVVFPIIRQSSFVLGLFSFLASWNDFLWPQLILKTEAHYTAQVALTQLNRSYAPDYATMMAGAVLITAPLILLFILVGRRLVSGVMDGAVKG
jgi:cellobiose transport system permease protein